jgi:hypothetical protein
MARKTRHARDFVVTALVFPNLPQANRAGGGQTMSPLRVRGLARVQLHADLTMLARLSQALARARTVSIAA